MALYTCTPWSIKLSCHVKADHTTMKSGKYTGPCDMYTSLPFKYSTKYFKILKM